MPRPEAGADGHDPACGILPESQMDGWPTSTVLTVTSCMSLPLLMHPWETRWGN